MNKLQGLNNAVFAGTLLALVAGVLRDPEPLVERPLILWVFVVFFFLLRLKIFMDDQKYFVKPDTDTPYFGFWLLLATRASIKSSSFGLEVTQF